jgi:hypothetical protein
MCVAPDLKASRSDENIIVKREAQGKKGGFLTDIVKVAGNDNLDFTWMCSHGSHHAVQSFGWNVCENTMPLAKSE